jgi:transposase
MKLAQDDAARICQRVVDHGVDTGLVAEQFEISRRRIQQLVKEYRESGEIPQLETPGRRPYAEYPDDLEERVLDLRQRLRAGAVVIAHVLRVRDGLSIANNRVHEILQEHDHVSENSTKQGRKRPWVRFEREHAAVTVHMDWYHNDRGQQVLTVEDDASQRVFDMIETDSSSASQAVELLASVDEEFDSPVPILEVITDHGSEFINPARMIGRVSITSSNAFSTTMTSSTRSAKSDGHSRTERSSGSSGPTRNTASGSELCRVPHLLQRGAPAHEPRLGHAGNAS